ncbi:unnamed protein product, partial [Rotaria socialis]
NEVMCELRSKMLIY